MTVRLRAHHLLCMLTFVGKGYTAEFTENYRRIAARLSAGEDLVIVSGPDDICAPLLAEQDAHCLGDSVSGRDARAAAAVGRLIGTAIATGIRLQPDEEFLARMRAAFSAGRIRDACAGCEWADLCTGIAATGFAGVLVGRPW